MISAQGLPWQSRNSAFLANGSVEHFDSYAATTVWDGRDPTILIQAIDGVPLLGMALLVGHDLRVRVAAGGIVEVEPIP